MQGKRAEVQVFRHRKLTSLSQWTETYPTFTPTFLYCTDLKEYLKKYEFYSDIRTWPYPLAENMDELKANIASFDQAAYEAACCAHHEKLGSCETGRATEYVCDRIAAVTKMN